jgi:hypothetical protein
MDQQATVRLSRDRQLQGAWVSYRVLIDDNEVGIIRSNRSVDFVVPPGEHVVQVLGRFPSFPQSNILDVQLNSGAVCVLRCSSSLSVKSLIGSGYFASKSPISIRLQEL